MHLLDELRAEHDAIERLAAAFLTYAGTGSDVRSSHDGAAFVRFFRQYAGHFHHAREEDVLFVALRDRAGLPADRGPIATMIADHGRLAALLDEVEAGLEAGADGEARVRDSVTAYVHALWHHIDAENSVLFPECEPRLRRNGVTELPSRQPTPDERDALAAGLALADRYAPSDSPAVMRGEGCIMCPAFGVTCRGLELEWWNEWEWDEFEDRMNAG